MTHGKFYGNSSMGMGYSPDRSRDVNHDRPISQFLGASGSRQGGYYSARDLCPSGSTKQGRYLGNGTYVED